MRGDCGLSELAPATVVVCTATGEKVWSMEGVASADIATLHCLKNFKGSILAAGIRRAVEDVEAIAAGRDPDREREEAGRLVDDLEEEIEADRLISAVLVQARADNSEPFTWTVKAQTSGELEVAIGCGKTVRVYRAMTDPAASGGILVKEYQTA